MEMKESWVKRKMSSKISVIGSGGWGTAIAVLLKKNGHDVTLWSWCEEESRAIRENGENKEFLPGVKLPDGIIYTSDIKKAAESAELIVLASPSHAIGSTAEKLAPYINGTPIVNVAKGFEKQGLLRLSEVIKLKCNTSVAVLSGPSHAEEVGKGLPTTVVAASEDEALAKRVQDIFMSDTFRVYTSTDVVGVEIGGALKNIIALCAGVIDGLGFGDNTKAALMTRGLAEITRLGIAMGAKPLTFAGLSGIGDLIVTCTSMHSRNRRAGILIGKGVPVDEALKEVHTVVEGVYATECAYMLAQKHGVEMPITEAAYETLFNKKSAAETVKLLMQRDKRDEEEPAAIV